jgi:hypothetical protein
MSFEHFLRSVEGKMTTPLNVNFPLVLESVGFSFYVANIHLLNPLIEIF